MAGLLHSTAKGVLKISLALLFVFAGIHTRAQSHLSIPVTYSAKAVKLDRVVDDLSRITGIYFVYSSNKIVANQAVSINVSRKPFGEVLDLIGRQLNLSFKSEGKHIVIKSVQLTARAISHPTTRTKEDIILASAEEQYAVPDRNYQIPDLATLKITSATELGLTGDYLQKSIIRFQSSFDSATLSNIPVRYVKKINRRFLNRGWFVLAGIAFNDYSSGFEVQGGVKSLYLIFSPTFISMEKLHAAYGIGTSIRLSEKFAVNPSYLYARMNESETFTYFGLPSFREKAIIDHHQVRLSLQYDHSKNISVRAGPTFNYYKSNYSYQAAEKSYFAAKYTRQYFVYVEGVPLAPPRQTVIKSMLQPNQVEKLQLGWEIVVAYRINFLKTR